MMIFQLLFYGLILGGAAYLALRGIRALEVGRGRPSDLDALLEELELLREAQHRLGNRITDLCEGREFSAQLKGKA